MSRLLADEQATLRVGAALAAAVGLLDARPDHGLHLHLRGELGSGKTTLVRGMLRALGVRAAVKSPTYTLVEHYATPRGPVYHFDLYRVADCEELELIGAREYFHAGAVCVFEWPERALAWLPAPSLELLLTHHGAARRLHTVPHDAAGEVLARALGDG